MSTQAVATQLTVNPYLNFNGHCEEALEFYKKEIGVQVTALLRFSDNPEPAGPGCAPTTDKNKVMHCSFTIGETTVMASDCEADGKQLFGGFSLAVSAPDEAKARGMFNALSNGGTTHMPMGPTFFSPCFGVVQDKFGVSWMIMVQPS